jgi:TonB family protein
VRPFLAALTLVCLAACAPAPAPVGPPVAPAPPLPSAPAAEQPVARTVYVTASALNVREEPSTQADIVSTAKRGAALAVLADGDEWLKVRLANGPEGWVAERYVGTQAETKKSVKRDCESDYSFIQTPALSFTEQDAHGLVVVEANVNVKGVVTSTRVISNSTGDRNAGAVAEREIRSAKFSPPIRDCQPRAFIFTYRRTF